MFDEPVLFEPNLMIVIAGKLQWQVLVLCVILSLLNYRVCLTMMKCEQVL